MTFPAPWTTGGLAARRSLLMLPPVLAAAAEASCARPEPPAPPLPPMSWTHLTPLPLDVAALEVVPSAPPAPPGDIGPLLSPSPAEAVRGMGRDRLSALGGSGQAVFLVTAASVVREPGGALRCSLGCRLDIAGRGGGEDDGPAFAEAATQRGVSGADAARPRAADLLLRRAMEDLNVEFEFQLRRNLRRWLVTAAPAGAAVPPPVSREELPPRAGAGEAAGPGGAAAGQRPPPEATPAGPEE